MTYNYTNPAAVPVMPDFSHAFYRFRHTLDSALRVLEALQIPQSRIHIRASGVGSASRCITLQSPSAGAPLFEDTQITLEVSERGFCRHLPVSMWHKGDERGLGTTEILELVDDPLQNALYWIREGARLLDISPHSLEACARWITLFGLNPELWPASRWYALACLLPNLDKLGGAEAGVRLALDLIHDLPLHVMRPLHTDRYLPEAALSLLGSRAHRLSIDYILGDRFEDAGACELVIGPVKLETYFGFQSPEGKSLLQRTLGLVMPSYSYWSVSWVVEDPSQYPRLGIASQNSLLGLNSYLGPEKKIAFTN